MVSPACQGCHDARKPAEPFCFPSSSGNSSTGNVPPGSARKCCTCGRCSTCALTFALVRLHGLGLACSCEGSDSESSGTFGNSSSKLCCFLGKVPLFCPKNAFLSGCWGGGAEKATLGVCRPAWARARAPAPPACYPLRCFFFLHLKGDAEGIMASLELALCVLVWCF